MANWEKLNKEFDDAITQFDKWADYKLRLADVSGQLPMCEHDYKQEDQYWYKCTKCGEISPIGNFRQRLRIYAVAGLKDKSLINNKK